jgi:SAM-dependent methyltransferase
MQASEDARTRDYFTRSAVPFDALYSEDQMSPAARWINRTFRRDIYERFVRTMDHVARNSLVSALDVGCGSGRYAQGLAERGVRRYVGIDFSPTMIELAGRNAPALAETGVDAEFICGDFTEFQTDERFDVVIGMGLFDYVSDPIAMLASMRAVSIHSVVASFPSISVYRTPVRKARYMVKRCPVYFYRRSAFPRLAAGAGFRSFDVMKIKGSGMDYFVTFLR